MFRLWRSIPTVGARIRCRAYVQLFDSGTRTFCSTTISDDPLTHPSRPIPASKIEFEESGVEQLTDEPVVDSKAAKDFNFYAFETSSGKSSWNSTMSSSPSFGKTISPNASVQNNSYDKSGKPRFSRSASERPRFHDEYSGNLPRSTEPRTSSSIFDEISELRNSEEFSMPLRRLHASDFQPSHVEMRANRAWGLFRQLEDSSLEAEAIRGRVLTDMFALCTRAIGASIRSHEQLKSRLNNLKNKGFAGRRPPSRNGMLDNAVQDSVGNTNTHNIRHVDWTARAANIFEQMLDHNFVKDEQLSLMMHSYVVAGKPQKALDLRSHFEELDVIPSEYMYGSMLNACSQLKDGVLAESLFEELQKKGIKYNLVLINSLLQSLAKSGLHARAFELYDKLPSMDLTPNGYIFSSMFQACAMAGDGARVDELTSRMVELGVRPNLHVLNRLCEALAKCSHPMEGLLELFEEMEPIQPGDRLVDTALRELKESLVTIGLEPDMIWEKILSSHLNPESCDRCVTAVVGLQSVGWKFTGAHLTAILDSVGSNLTTGKVMRLFNDIWSSDPSAITSELVVRIMNLFLELQDSNAVFSLHKRIMFKSSNLLTTELLNCVLKACVENEDTRLREKYYQDYTRHNIPADLETYIILLECCERASRQGDKNEMESARFYFIQMPIAGITADERIYRILIRMYANGGYINEAMDILEDYHHYHTEEPQQVSVYEQLLNAMVGKESQSENALKIFEWCKSANVGITPSTVNLVLRSLSTRQEEQVVMRDSVSRYVNVGIVTDGGQASSTLDLSDIVTMNSLIRGLLRYVSNLMQQSTESVPDRIFLKGVNREKLEDLEVSDEFEFEFEEDDSITYMKVDRERQSQSSV